MRLPRWALSITVVVAFACVTDTAVGPEGIASLTVVPDSADLALGATRQLIAVARDSNGVPYVGLNVAWSSSSDMVATVSADGLVTGAALGMATITGTAGGISASAQVMVVPPPAIVLSSASVSITGVANGPAPASETVSVTNGGGAALTGLGLGAITYGPGAIDWLNASLDQGVAPATLTLTAGTTGLAVGTYSASLPVTSTVAANSPQTVTVTLSVTVDVPTQIALDTGDGQSAAVNTAVPIPPSVIVRDQFDNPVPGVAVTFAVTAGGGSLTGGNATTNASGIAAAGSWTLGLVVGTNTLDATATGLSGSPVTFTATATAGAASQITATAGDGQSATVGSPVSVAPTVLVRDQFNNPVAGVAVTFAVTSGGGSISGASQTTDGSGLTAVGMWTLGTAAGANTLTATAPALTGSPVTFTATGAPAPAAQIAASAGDAQSAPVNAAVATPPAVLVTDQFGNPISGVAVTFAVASGGGAITGATPTTNASGIAAVGSWTLGTTAGTNALTATSAGLSGSPVTFTATATAGAAAQMALNAGNTQTATVNTAVAVPPSVLLRDQFNNPVPGVAVTFAVTGGGGTVTGGNATTNASGIATASSWTLGSTAGANTLTATAPGLTGSPVTFTATGTAAAASQIALNAGDGQTATVNTAVAVAPSVLVRDQFNNPVAGVAVTFAVTAGGGGVSGANATTNASGIATVGSWTLGTAAGTNNNILTATATGLAGSPVTFTASATAGAATQITLNAGDGQSATVNTAVSVAPSVAVRDQFNNPVAGAAVTFVVTAGGGSVTGGNATTTASGIATVGSWTLGTAAGTNNNTLTATATGLAGSPVTFTASATAGAATQMTLNAGDGQSAPVNTPVPIPPSVLVRDQFSNPVAGVAVTFLVTAGSGSVAGGNTISNAGGIAQVTSWTLGSAVGPYSLTATAGLAGSPVTFTATATAAAAAQIALNAGNNQTATVNTAVAIAPSVLVRDQFNNPVAGVAVTFAVTGGGGSVTGANATTDASGIATVGSWTLGTTAGTNSLTASSAGLTGSPVPFTATATAGAATQVALNAGDGQTATVNTAVTVNPSVLVRDQFNNPVSGVTVTFAVTAGGGSVTGGNATTNANGIATVGSWTLGTTAGTSNNTLTATSSGLSGSPVTFTATTTAGAAAQIAVSTGNNQSAQVSTAVPIPPSVFVRDQFGNPVAGVSVTFAVASGGGTVNPTTALTTNASGIVQVTSWTLGSAAGTNTLTATSAPVLAGSPVTFTATAFSGSATQMALNAGDAQTDTVGATLALAYSVIVRDGSNNPVVGIPVGWAVPPGQGSITPATSNTDASGIATATRTLGTTAGPQTATASAGGLTGSPVTFTASAAAGLATQVILNTGDGQAANVSTAVAVAPSVVVRDQFNNPVPGHSVTFTVTGGGGSIVPASPATVQSDASGIAAVTSWTMGPSAGANTLTASSTGLAGSPIGFTATATPATPTQIALNAGDGQTAPVNTAVALAPSVIVRDAFNNPVGGVAVTFAVTGGGGNVTGENATTDAGGIATVGSWTLGTVAGAGNNVLQATSTGLAGSPVVFTASAAAGAAQTIALNAGDNQTATVNTAVAIDPAVLVTDQFGNPVQGVAVAFAVQTGGGGATGGNATTNASGIATVGSWTLGTLAGTNNNSLTATSAGLVGSPVTFTASATAGAAQTIAQNVGDNQTATVNTAVAIDPAVLATDQFGNPVQGVAVTFAVQTGGGGVTGGNATTNAGGIATVVSWTLGITAGANNNTLTATSSGLTGSPVTFTASTTAGAPAVLVISAGNGQTATVNTAVAVDPAVLVTDAFGNPVPSVAVTFTPGPGSGSVAGSPATTNASGIATVTSWTLGTGAGPNSLEATHAALTPVTFTATGTADVATQIAVNAGDGQSATVNTAVAIDPSVLVTDQYGNPVSGVSVTFAVSGGGSVNPMTALFTDANGIATVTSWTLGTTAGSNTLSATSSPALTGSPVTFTATGTADAAFQIALNAGNGQSATVNTAVATDPSVLVRDQFSNPVQGHSVTFTVTGGGGSTSPASPATVVTDAAGIAAVTSWTLGTTAGSNTLQTTSTGLTGSPVNFTATGTPDAVSAAQTSVVDNAATITACSISCTVAGGTADSVTVTVRDQYGNVISGASVTVSATGTSNTFSPAATGTTNASGVYAVRLSSIVAQAKTISATAGPTATVITQTASVTVNPAAVSLSNSLLSASDNSITACSVSCSTGGNTASTMTATVRDAFSNLISGAIVTFSSTGTGNTFTASATDTTSAGVASRNFNSTTAQAKTISAFVSGVGTITQTAAVTVNPAAAANLTINLGNNQIARVSSAVATDPSVLVEDAFGNNISGASVNFYILEGSGLVSGLSSANHTTNASGVATVTSWTMGSTGTEGAEGSGTFAGQFENRLRARIVGVDSVDFTGHGFYTYTGDVGPIIGAGATYPTSQCSGCHYSQWTRANIVSVNQSDGVGFTLCTIANSVDQLVNISNASLSLIYVKTSAAPCGSTMPTSSGLTITQRKIIRAWINDGALNN